MKATYYTLVQHSAFVVTRDPQFKKAVELETVPNRDTLNEIIKLQGYVFTSYNDASAAEYNQNYQADNLSLTPCVPGDFIKETCNGKPLYIHQGPGKRNFAIHDFIEEFSD